MVTLKRVYEPPAPGDGLRVLVDRRWPWRLNKATAAIDRWERELAPSVELHRWFGGRRARWAEFRARYTFELGQHGAELACLRAAAAGRPVTLLYAARNPVQNSAAVLQEVLRSSEPGLAAADMSHAELLGFMNRLLAGSRTTVREARVILQSTATRMLDIKRDEAYASAVLIQLIKSLGGRPDYNTELNEEIPGGAGLASRLALFERGQLSLMQELERNLPRIADDRIRRRLQKLLIARVRNIRRLDGKPHLALADREPHGRCRETINACPSSRAGGTGRDKNLRNRPTPRGPRHP
jgi:uncharacterized protein YeaO (DUF488 family)